MTPTNGSIRIAVTGGPGGGKTTAADLFRRELGDCVVVVPEADEAAWRQLLQRAPFCASGVFEAVANVDS